MHVRGYHQADQAACMALFDSNTPPYFATSERAEYQDFLARPWCPYFVVADAGDVVAAGGYLLRLESGDAFLIWGMVRRDRHAQGIGQFLTRARLQLIAAEARVRQVLITTSQHTARFYQRLGFVDGTIEADGFGPGLHKHHLTLALDAAARTRLQDAAGPAADTSLKPD